MEHTDFSQTGSSGSVFRHMYQISSMVQEVLSRRIQSKAGAKPALPHPISTLTVHQSTPVTETSPRWSQPLPSAAAALLAAESRGASLLDPYRRENSNVLSCHINHSITLQKCKAAVSQPDQQPSVPQWLPVTTSHLVTERTEAFVTFWCLYHVQ